MPDDIQNSKSADNGIRDLRSPELAAHWLSAIIESADDAIISKTLEGIITSWNQGAERIFGYTAAEIVGKPVTTLIPDEEATILSRIRRGERVEHYETLRKRKDGSLVEISLTVSPIKSAEGQVIGASKVARDITKQRQAQRAPALSFREIDVVAIQQAVGHIVERVTGDLGRVRTPSEDDGGRPVMIPVMGRIAAGTPIEAILRGPACSARCRRWPSAPWSPGFHPSRPSTLAPHRLAYER